MREGKPMSLLVRNLRYTTSPDRVRKFFEQFGNIRDVYLPLDYYTKLPRGFGFVEFSRDEDAETALQALSSYATLDGAEISVTVAQQGRKSPDSMRHRERAARQSRITSGGPGGGGAGPGCEDYRNRRGRSSRSMSPCSAQQHSRRYGPPRRHMASRSRSPYPAGNGSGGGDRRYGPSRRSYYPPPGAGGGQQYYGGPPPPHSIHSHGHRDDSPTGLNARRRRSRSPGDLRRGAPPGGPPYVAGHDSAYGCSIDPVNTAPGTHYGGYAGERHHSGARHAVGRYDDDRRRPHADGYPRHHDRRYDDRRRPDGYHRPAPREDRRSHSSRGPAHEDLSPVDRRDGSQPRYDRSTSSPPNRCDSGEGHEVPRSVPPPYNDEEEDGAPREARSQPSCGSPAADADDDHHRHRHPAKEEAAPLSPSGPEIGRHGGGSRSGSESPDRRVHHAAEVEEDQDDEMLSHGRYDERDTGSGDKRDPSATVPYVE